MRPFPRGWRFRILYRIILPYLVLTILVAAIGAVLGLYFANRNQQERFDNQLLEVGTRFNDALLAQEAENLNVLYQIAFAPANTNPNRSAPAVSAAIEDRDTAGLRRALIPYFQVSVLRDDWNFDRLIVFDTEGQSLFDWQRKPNDPTGQEPIEYASSDLSAIVEIQKINSNQADALGDKFTGIIKFENDPTTFYLYSVAPVKHNNQLVGGVLVAARIQDILLRLERQTQSAVTFFYDNNGSVINTTATINPNFNLTPDQNAINLSSYAVTSEQMEVLQRGFDHRILTVNEREYEFLYGPLIIREKQVGYFSVALSTSFLFDSSLFDAWTYGIIASLLSLGIIVLGSITARTITKPLDELVKTAEAVSNGQLDKRSASIEVRHEIGSLAVAFNQMTEHLLQLYQTSQSLNGAIDIDQVLKIATIAANDIVPNSHAIALLEEPERISYQVNLETSGDFFALDNTTSNLTSEQLSFLLEQYDQQAVSVDQLNLLGRELQQVGVQSVLMTRIIVQEKQAGVLLLVHKAEEGFEPSVIPSLRALSNMAAPVLHNSLLYYSVTRESKKQQAILQAITDGVILIDRQGFIVMANAAAENLLELKDWHIQKMRFQDVSLNHIPANRELFGRSTSAEYYETGPYTLAISRAPVTDQDDQLLGEVIVIHDLSEEAAVSQAKTDFIATISHEIRTPLTPMFGYLDMLLRGYVGPLTEEQLDMLTQVRKRSNDIFDLVKNMIMVASIEADTLTIDQQDLDVAAIVELALMPLRPVFRQKNLEIKVDIPDDLPYMHTDRELLKLILTQLIENAHRFTKEGGIVVRARADGAMIQIDIEDTGIGIPSEAQGRLFTRFQRVEGNNSPERGGGLGLSITRQIVERLGGYVWLTSEEGQGSTFSFVLPQAQEQIIAVSGSGSGEFTAS
jgi:signal transduction histidine kinase/methyl-accepting chemotaxis protein